MTGWEEGSIPDLRMDGYKNLRGGGFSSGLGAVASPEVLHDGHSFHSLLESAPSILVPSTVDALAFIYKGIAIAAEEPHGGLARCGMARDSGGK